MPPRDPPIRKDGRCRQCRGERKMPKTGHKAARESAAVDPFCSTECCRTWHGVPLVGNAKRGTYV